MQALLKHVDEVWALLAIHNILVYLLEQSLHGKLKITIVGLMSFGRLMFRSLA
jgi:hypothetical protein